MEHPRITQMEQNPLPHYGENGNDGGVGFGVPFEILPAASDRQQMVYNLPPSIDVDQGLSNAFSSLNLSNDRRSFLPETLDGGVGGVGSPAIGVGEGFGNPFRSNASTIGFEESLWALNTSLNNQHRNYSGVGHSNPLTVDPHHPLLCYGNRDEYESSSYYLPQGGLLSGFDQLFDFDQRSDLLRKKHLYPATQLNSVYPCSSNHAATAFVDESLYPSNIMNNNSGLSRSNLNNLNLRYKNLNHACGVPSKLQNHQLLSFLSLKELRGRIVYLAKDQNGCRILQSKFENPTKEEIEIVLSEVLGCISDLMKDQFGNYLVQKLVAVCDDDQKTRILLQLTNSPIEIVVICMNPHGTRAVQKLLENLNEPKHIALVMAALRPGASTLANDPNGHHVIQYCLVHFPIDLIKPILDEIANKCFKVATDRSGCCVLQACVEHSRGEVRTRLVSEIMTNALLLAEDPFGNYVLQHMLGLKVPEFTAELVRQLQGNFASLSRNKYASNVVEKCLNESGEEVSTRIILELIRSPNSSLLLVDPYANFVIQSALKVSKGFAHECLRDLIAKNAASMRSNLYGKKILEWFEKRRILLV